uniref:Uncharacterized protein n=1 Tax=Meloidogyne incognita TaxID=6306 RepID=A0A914NBY1_MELIC
MSIIREYAAKIVTIIPIKPKKTSIIFKEIIGLKLHGYIFTILTSSKIISVFGREIFKKMFEKFKKSYSNQHSNQHHHGMGPDRSTSD